MNHISPLIRWITKINKERSHSFFNVSSLRASQIGLPPGDYCYRVDRWRLRGLSSRESLAYGVQSLHDPACYWLDGSAEAVILQLRSGSEDWPCPDCDAVALISAYERLEQMTSERFNQSAAEFEAENANAYQIRVQRVCSGFDRRLGQDAQRLKTLREAGRDPRVIRLTEARIRLAEQNRANRLRDLEEQANIDMELAPVAGGVFRVRA